MSDRCMGARRRSRCANHLAVALLALAPAAGAEAAATVLLDPAGAGGPTLIVFDAVAGGEANNFRVDVGPGGGVRVAELAVGFNPPVGPAPVFFDGTTVEYAAGVVAILIIGAEAQGDTIVINDTPGDLLSCVASGKEGSDSITVNDTHTTVATAADGGDGSDILSLTGGHGPLITFDGVAGGDLIIVTNTQATTTVIVGGADNDAIDINGASGGTLIVSGADGADDIDVLDVNSTVSTLIFGDSDSDSFTATAGGGAIPGAGHPILAGTFIAGDKRRGAAEGEALLVAGADDIDVQDAHGPQFIVSSGPANDFIDLFDTHAGATALAGDAGVDTITIHDASTGNVSAGGGTGNDVMLLIDCHNAAGSTVLSGDDGNDDVDVGDAHSNQVAASGGNDSDTMGISNMHVGSVAIFLGDTSADAIAAMALEFDEDFLDALEELAELLEDAGGGASLGGPGDDTIQISDSFAPQLLVVGGPGSDHVDIFDTHTSTFTQVFGNAGFDSLHIFDAHTPTIVASGDADGDDFTLFDTHATTTQLTGGAAVDIISISNANGGSLAASGDDGNDFITLNNTNATVATVLAGGNDVDTVNVNDANGPLLQALLGSGNDTVNIAQTGGGAGGLADFAISGDDDADTVNVNGQISVSGQIIWLVEQVNVNGGGDLMAAGQIQGMVDVFAGGRTNPGNSPGILAVGDTQYNAGSVFDEEINGTGFGTDFDTLLVTGTIDLGGATLNLTGTHVPQPNDVFILVLNDGADPVVGTFAGLPEGSQVVFNGVTCFITYAAGDGNDVALFGPVVITIADAQSFEGNPPDANALVFIVIRSHNVGDHSVDFAMQDITAGSVGAPPAFDYAASAGMLNFPTGGTVFLPVVAPILADEIVELDEFMFVNLSNPSAGVVIDDAQALGTISNEDRGFITINNVSMQEGDSGIKVFTFQALLDHAVDVPVTIDFATQAQTAKVSDNDYLFTAGQRTFLAVNPNEVQLINVVVVGDTCAEANETFLVILSNIQALGRNVTFADNAGLGTILNDDANGACCLPADGSCVQTCVVDCNDAGGVFFGEGNGCGSVACPPPPTGACCSFDGSCAVKTALQCAAGGGEYQGDNVTCAAVTCLVAGAVDQRRGTSSEKGSYFIFHKVELRWAAGAAAPTLVQDTFLSLTNDNNLPVQVQMYFVNGDPPLDAVLDDNTGAVIERAHPGWNWLDNGIALTANQPTYWAASTGQPASGGLSPFTALDPGVPPGRPAQDGTTDRVLRGFIVGWAVNASGQEIRWNHLAGNATIVHYAAALAWEYAAQTHAVVANVGEGLAPDAKPGRIALDGNEYALGADELLLNFQAPGANAFSGPRQIITDTDLTIHPLSTDLRQATTGPVTTKADFTIWNQNEVKFSGTHRCVTCWDQTLLSQYDSIPNHFLVAQLQTAHGKARIDGHHAPLQCDDPLARIYSIKAAITGVAARFLAFDPGMANAKLEAAGYELPGVGFEAAIVRFDAGGGGGQEAEAPEEAGLELPFNATPEEIKAFLDELLKKNGR